MNPGGESSDAIAAQLPGPIAELVAGGEWQVVAVAADGATRWRVATPEGPVELAVAPAGNPLDRLAAQRRRLSWLAGQVPVVERVRADGRAAGSAADQPPTRASSTGAGGGLLVPEVLASAADPDSGDGYLATTVVPGTPAIGGEHRGDVDALVVALARGLRAVHDLPVEACPFERSVDDLMTEATMRVAAGAVVSASLSEPYRRYPPPRLLELAAEARLATADADHDRVVTLGRPTPANTLIHRGRVSGYADWADLAVGDRYLDLAVATRALAQQVSPHALGPFVDAYGIDGPDLVKLDFFVLLVELLGIG